MSIRAAKFVSAVLTGILLAAPQGAARAADDCPSGPTGPAPAGSHWYYRIDHATKRHCWYVGAERANSSQVTPAISPRSVKPGSPPRAEPTIERSIADAHAELPSQTPVQQSVRIGLPAPIVPPNAASEEDNTGMAAAQIRPSAVATRWPDPSAALSTSGPAPTSRATTINPTAPSEPAILASSQLAEADASPAGSDYSAIMQSAAVLMAAVALAGIIGSVIFNFGSAKPPAQAKIRARRGAIWEPTDDDSIQLNTNPEIGAPPRRRGFARGPDRAYERNARIAAFFSQLANRTSN